MIDIGGGRESTGGIQQYELCRAATVQNHNNGYSQSNQCHFDIGSERAKGTGKIFLLIGNL